MRPSKTTLAGTSAAVCYSAAQVPSLPQWLRTCFEIGAAVSLATLGLHASDCPANCPGTGPDGQPRARAQQIKLPIFCAGVLAVFFLLTAGCTVPNPKAGPAHPEQPAYIVSPGLPAVSNAAVQISREVGDLTQTGPLLTPIVVGIFTAIGGVSALVAQARSHKRQVETLTSRPRPAGNSQVDRTESGG